MNQETIYKIKTTPAIYRYLREDSSHYKYLYRDNSYIRKLEEQAKEKYQERMVDKVEKIKDGINLISTFMSVIE